MALQMCLFLSKKEISLKEINTNKNIRDMFGVQGKSYSRRVILKKNKQFLYFGDAASFRVQ